MIFVHCISQLYILTAKLPTHSARNATDLLQVVDFTSLIQIGHQVSSSL